MSQDLSTTNRSEKSSLAPRTEDQNDGLLASIVSPTGYILAVSYPVLALSTGVRAIVQLARVMTDGDFATILPPAMSAVAALCYLAATVGFAYRRKWSWWLSAGVLGLETVLTVVIGVWSYIEPALIGRTVWRHFGEDYGYFPLFQPLLGLVWLFWRETQRAYGFSQHTEPESSTPE